MHEPRTLLHDLGQALHVWRERRAARRALAQIDARSLRDAGISPQLAEYEINRPSWQPLRDWRA